MDNQEGEKIYRIYINILTFIYIRDGTRRVKPFPILSSFGEKKILTWIDETKPIMWDCGSTKFNHPLATNVTHGKLLVARLTIKGKLKWTLQYIINKVSFMQQEFIL